MYPCTQPYSLWFPVSSVRWSSFFVVIFCGLSLCRVLMSYFYPSVALSFSAHVIGCTVDPFVQIFVVPCVILVSLSGTCIPHSFIHLF